MAKYIFTGDRGDISLAVGGHTLKHGDQVELSDEQARDLIASDFPIQRAEPEEVTEHGSI